MDGVPWGHPPAGGTVVVLDGGGPARALVGCPPVSEQPPVATTTTRTGPIRLLLVDDHRMVLDGLTAMLRPHAALATVVASTTEPSEARRLAVDAQPDIALIDVRMKATSGLDLCEELLRVAPGIKVVLLTVYDDEQYLFQGLRAGASGYLTKQVVAEELLTHLRRVLEGEIVIDASLAGRVALSAARLHRGEFWPGAHLGLSQRESEVLELMVHGNSNRAIAHRLVLGEETVKTHVRSIFRKLDVSDRTQAVAFALREGIFLMTSSSDLDLGKSAAGTDSAAADRAWADLLRQIIELSTEERNLRRVLRRVAEFVVATTRADVCFVHVVDTAAHEIVLMGATPEPFDQLAGTIRLAFGEGVAGWVAQHAKPAVVRDKWSDPRYVYIPALKGEEFNSMISVPLLRPEGVVGVLNVHSRNADHFQPGDVARLGEVASVLAGIVENAVLYDRLATREAEVARFAAQTIEMQELDRRRIAANIHDGISQRLVSAWYHLRAARDLLVADGATAGGPPVVVEIATTLALLSDALDDARHAIVGLRPAILDDLGLTAGLTSLATSLGCDAEIELDLQSVTLPADVETALYRISQEALQNVMKHAQAQQVRIGLHESADGRVTLSVSDDGVGFEPSQAAGAMSYGMAGMQERATLIGAHLEVRSRLGDGSAVIVTLPAGGVITGGWRDSSGGVAAGPTGGVGGAPAPASGSAREPGPSGVRTKRSGTSVMDFASSTAVGLRAPEA